MNPYRPLALIALIPTFLAAQAPLKTDAVTIIKKVIENQKAVNLSYDAQANITFYDRDGEVKSQREVLSRYTVKKGIIKEGKRIGYAEAVPPASTGDRIPKYRENHILPLFSPLSQKALPHYNFRLAKQETRDSIATLVITYAPIVPGKDFSHGTIWISQADWDLVALEMHAARDFNFTEDFVMKMDYRKESDLWVPERILCELNLNIFNLYRRRVVFDQKVIRRYP